jgi:sulfite exporter TauE/SafE
LELTFYTALMIGLLGSPHCIGMCGGIVGALSTGSPRAARQSRFSMAAYHLTYNAGRILSYTFAGAVAGSIGAQASRISLVTAAPIGALITGLFMIALGFYIAGWWRVLTVIEKAGQHFWKFVEPLGRRFLPIQKPSHAFGLGVVWGWLPCSLVYSALALSMMSASSHGGALLMLGFGLGTLPVLLVIGNLAEHLRKLVRHPALRQVAGASVILLGVYTCLTAFGEHGNRHGPVVHGNMGHQEETVNR